MGIAALSVITGLSALAANVRANRAPTPQLSKSVLKAPSSAIDLDEDETEINLGSERSQEKGRRRGRRQLMTPRARDTSTPSPSSTGLQI